MITRPAQTADGYMFVGGSNPASAQFRASADRVPELGLKPDQVAEQDQQIEAGPGAAWWHGHTISYSFHGI